MITNTDRAKWIGASDSSYLFGTDGTATKDKWWAKKLGINKSQLNNVYTITGNALEHRIVELINPAIKKGTKPVYIRKYRLRVNYDGLLGDKVIEIKTSKSSSLHTPKKVPLNYWRQCQVLMYATGRKKTELWYYILEDENYKNYFLELDKDKLIKFDIQYDEEWIKNEYLPRLKKYADYLKQKRWYTKWIA